MFGGVQVQLHAFLASALDGSEWLLHDPAALPLENEQPVPIG